MEYLYGALLLHKLGKTISEESLNRVIQGAGETPDPAKVKTLVASLKGVDIEKELENASIALAAPQASSAESKAAKEEKKEEKREEAAEGLSALFG